MKAMEAFTADTSRAARTFNDMFALQPHKADTGGSLRLPRNKRLVSWPNPSTIRSGVPETRRRGRDTAHTSDVVGLTRRVVFGTEDQPRRLETHQVDASPCQQGHRIW